MIRLLLGLAMLFWCFGRPVMGQARYFTKTGHISFYSKATLEDIEAQTKQAVSFLDFSTGEMVFSVPMKSFQFKKALMQEHFNENYVESDKYPKATFKGKITNSQEVDLSRNNLYKVAIEGVLTLHGVDRPVKTTGTLDVKGKQVQGLATFSVTPQEFNIEIPFLVREHIAKQINITVSVLYVPYKEKSL